MLTNALPFALGVLLASASAPDSGTARRAAFDAEDVLAKTRAAYAALTSHADSGTVLDEATGFTDRSSFRTLFNRDPRHQHGGMRHAKHVAQNVTTTRPDPRRRSPGLGPGCRSGAAA